MLALMSSGLLSTGRRRQFARINRDFTFTAIYSHFFAGRFLKETPPGKDVDYTSTWLMFRF